MILDTIDHAAQYRGLHPGIDRALEAVRAYTPENYPGGRVELDGGAVALNLNSYETGPAEGALTEAHRQYIDVMYMVEGVETIYVKPVEQLRNVTQPYDPAIDTLLAATDPDTTAVRLEAGSFIVLFPQDAHCPARCAGDPMKVKKIIGKVRI